MNRMASVGVFLLMDARGRDGLPDGGGDPAPGPATLTDSFEAFYRRTYGTLASALTYTIGDEDLAVEATDEAMVRAYARWAQVSVLDNPPGWVYRVGLNWARSVHRRLARRPPPSTARDVDEPAAADVELRAALLALDADLRSVVVCRHLFDWSVEQTAEALGIKAGTVKSRLHRATGQLAARLSAHEHAGGEQP